ncbi:hypothetical protein LSAT2_007375, partial [Lamellibrachia satsuma]
VVVVEVVVVVVEMVVVMVEMVVEVVVVVVEVVMVVVEMVVVVVEMIHCTAIEGEPVVRVLECHWVLVQCCGKGPSGVVCGIVEAQLTGLQIASFLG